MAALQDAIAQIDALISRLQTEPLANGAPATHASASWPMPPVLATLSTAEQPRSSAAAAVDTASAGTAVPQATLPHAAASADASSHPDAGSGHQVGQQPAGGAASAAGDSQPAQDGRASAKKVKPAKAPKAPPPEPTPADMFARAHIQVARVLEVTELESSDKLYKTRVQVRNGDQLEERQILAGLRKHVARSELEGSLVVVILNLKTAKLAGEASEGMILAGVHADGAAEHGELVKPVRPPEGSQAGDRVAVEGEAASEDFPKVLKSDAWKKLAALLRVEGGAATVDGRPLVTTAGRLTVAAGMPDGARIS